MTAGGVSVGGEDHVRAAVETNGSINLWRMKIKPGKPTALGQIGDCAFVGLPGNPVSAQVMFMMFARPVILRLAGATEERPFPVRFRLPAAFDFDKDHERREFLRARLQTGADGSPEVVLHRGQGSHIISSMVGADGLIDLPEGPRMIERGQPVEFIPFTALS
jgi:molybdopterin molybdotransferase